MIWEAVGLVSGVVVLGGYAVAQARDNMRIYDWTNALWFTPLALSSAVVGAWGAVLVTVGFGAVGVFGLAKHWRTELLHRHVLRRIEEEKRR